MNSRLGLVGILMVGCLAVIPMMNGCSDDNGGNDAGTTDGGGKKDAGTDAGTADAGSPKGSIGDRCADSTSMGQSTCQRTNECWPLTDSNYCSKECQDNSECGANGSYDNVCVDIGATNPLCLRGCDPNDRSTCGRVDLACYPADDTNTTGFCVPGCSTDADCNYGYLCDTDSGLCNRAACGAGDTCDSADDVCYSRVEDGKTVKSCIPKCSTSGCPSDRTCNTETEICDPIVNDTWEPCGPTVASCVDGDICLNFPNDAGGLCYQTCTMDEQCPSGATCSLPLQDGSKVCSVECGTSDAPDDAACPEGLACLWTVDQTNLFCGPPQDQ